MDIAWREPLEIVAGDTLAFNRRLGAYPAPAYHLLYELRGGAQPIEFTSVQFGATPSHFVTVPVAVTATWLPGDYTLTGYAVSADGTERHQICELDIPVKANAQAEAGDADIRTFAQKMVDNLELVMLGKAGADLLESRIGETQFRYLTPEQLRTEHGYWKTVRRMEEARARARAGRPTGLVTRPVMSIISPGGNRGLFGRGSAYGGW